VWTVGLGFEFCGVRGGVPGGVGGGVDGECSGLP
jgi:hypothetical protein